MHDYSSVVEFTLSGATIAALGLGALTMSAGLLALTGAMAVASLLVIKLWTVIESLVIKHTNVIQVLGQFELSGDREAATTIVDGGYTATSAALVESAHEASLGAERLEAIVSHVATPFRFVVQAERLDLKGFTERLETRKHMREIELSRIRDQGSGRGQLRANRLKNEIAEIEHEMTALGAGIPLRLTAYITASSSAPTRRGAEDLARSHIRALAAELGAVGIACTLVTGAELLKTLRFDAAVNA